MSDELRKYAAGDRWMPDAAWLNKVTDAVKDQLRRYGSMSAPGDNTKELVDVVWIENATATSGIDQYGVTGIADLVFQPSGDVT